MNHHWRNCRRLSRFWTLLIVILLTGVRAAIAEQPDKALKQSVLNCPGIVFSVEKLGRFVEQARRDRTDLPPAPENYKAGASHDGCMYLYVERYGPNDRYAANLFVLDPYGDIYSVDSSCEDGGGLTNAEVMSIVVDARSKGSGLPAAPPSFTTEIEKTECHHVYREIPKSDTESTVSITIGPYGEILEVRKDGKIVK
jgi:hypothetical protein